MSSLMYSEMSLYGEAFSTYATHILLLPGMCTLMFDEKALPGEALSALIT